MLKPHHDTHLGLPSSASQGQAQTPQPPTLARLMLPCFPPLDGGLHWLQSAAWPFPSCFFSGLHVGRVAKQFPVTSRLSGSWWRGGQQEKFCGQNAWVQSPAVLHQLCGLGPAFTLCDVRTEGVELCKALRVVFGTQEVHDGCS